MKGIDKQQIGTSDVEGASMSWRCHDKHIDYMHATIYGHG